MLGDKDFLSNVAVKDLSESKKFYVDILGLKVLSETPFGIMMAAGKNGGRIFMYKAPTAGTGEATVCSWEVGNVKSICDQLEKAGAKFEHYEFPGATHDGHVHIMGKMKSAWFRDPSGNILGLSEGTM